MATVIPGDLSEVRDTQKVPSGKRKRGETKPRKNFPCQLCDKAFNSVEKLKVHSYSHTGERPYKCIQQDCTKAFVSKYKLQRHMATHSPEKTHKCNYCEKMFHRKDHLKNHLHTHDPNKETFTCEECGKNYNTKLGFKRHLALHAATSGDLTCKVCLQTFESTGVLLEHLKSHAGKSSGGVKEKKHQCEHCDRRFYTRKDVRRHMVVHTGRKDFLCQYCAQRFGRKDHLTRHMKKSHNQELRKVKTEPVDFLDPFTCNVSVPIKDELLPVMSLPSSELLSKPFTNTLQLNLYNTPFQSMQSSGSAHQMITTLPLGMTCPIDMDAVHPSHHLSFKYPFSSTSYAISIPEKEQPLKGEIESYLMELQGSVPPSSQDSQASSSKLALEPQIGSLDDGTGDLSLSKSSISISEPLNTAALDFSQLFNFIPLSGPPYNPISVGSLGVSSPQEEAHSSVAQLPPQTQELPDPAGTIGLGSLHSLSAAFTSSLSTSTTLPRFHQAFQ
ncbi:zinc finger protein PLAG1 isoform X1 [Neophocaena asiaeorientalis asiaeorientalis]|nr:zinc finger protein PLAG1 isoform X1 [Orcinus orca]XP_019780877.1 zinc finger protein PLAG1 isoform X1 [Tursiops truncatus]XP_024598411.1 zinc finger protein PLAG1 isoform X1 [Neophocaena asiaeorientalis asiaeorientalis]XP_029079064.1 zinc finger protein PLAG1 isoform X1 [Monodon monoceros]XP_029079065.1 zinc finger protein PLAG1 isoform X1 [Monodon monoceros]XP_030715582.1 zinc finger protein PLAG1 isoform X1 [Globicephala melas]XP_030715583.1 zinc finger protein PLAG1 isoform X1 [Globice